jgi:2,3-bisphosphoglycerate-dependent phosphoglycerate mutase
MPVRPFMKRFTLFLAIAFVLVESVSAEPFVVIVRHAEKETGGGDNPGLTAAGRARAEMLAQMVKDSAITAIFTTELKRTQETAAPAASALGIQATVVPAKDSAALVAKLRELKGNALVVGHGNTIPEITKALGIDTPINIADADYTELFVVTLGAKPQLVRLHYPTP